MAKSKVAQIRPAEQPDAPRTVPLSDITITWPRRNHFEADERRTPVTLNGERLSQVVSWIEQTRPGRMTASSDTIWDEGEVQMSLEGLHQVLCMLGEVDHERAALDYGALFWFLSESLRDHTARLGAALNAKHQGEDGTVTIAPAAGR
jgi:hypothetical protein